MRWNGPAKQANVEKEDKIGKVNGAEGKISNRRNKRNGNKFRGGKTGGYIALASLLWSPLDLVLSWWLATKMQPSMSWRGWNPGGRGFCIHACKMQNAVTQSQFKPSAVVCCWTDDACFLPGMCVAAGTGRI